MKIALSFAMAMLLLVGGCATVPSDAPAFTQAPAPNSGQGLVYIYRVGAYPTMRTPDILVNDKLLFAPPEKSYTWVHLPVGTNKITVDWAWDTGWPDLSFEINVTEHAPVFLRLSGSFENLGRQWRAGSKATGLAPAVAERELAECCKYVPAKARF